MASTLSTLGVGRQRQGDYTQAAAYFEEALPLLREVGDKQWTSIVLSNLGLLAFYQGNNDQAVVLSEESLALFQSSGDIRGIASVLTNLGIIRLEQGDYTQVLERCEESLALRREMGDKGGSAHTLLVLGRMALYTQQYQQADIYYKESLAIYRDLEEKEGVALTLEGLAGLWTAQGHFSGAARLLAAAGKLRVSTDVVLSPVDRAFKERTEAKIRAQLGKVAFNSTWDEGRTLDYGQIVTLQGTDPLEPLALTTQPPVVLAPTSKSHLTTPQVPSPLTYPNQLTGREIEILRLVAGGLSDKEVAERLVISPRTVQGHVRSIFSKIQVNSRTAATRYAITHNLV